MPDLPPSAAVIAAPEIPPEDTERPLGRPRAMPEAARRQQIVDSAASVFSRKGYWATTMDDVSRQAGMSKRTVYQLFSSKADIFDLLLHSFVEPFSLPFDTEGRSARAVLTEGLLRLASAALDEKQMEITRVLIAEAARPGDVADAIERRGICQGGWALQEWLATQDAIGSHPVEDPEEMASTILWAAIGDLLFTTLLRIRPCPCQAEIEARVDRVVSFLYA